MKSALLGCWPEIPALATQKPALTANCSSLVIMDRHAVTASDTRLFKWYGLWALWHCLKMPPQLHQHVNESAQRRDLRPLGELCQRRFFCSRNSRPIANALDGRAWQYTTRACVRNSPVEESSRMTLPGSQGQSVKMRAPCEVTFSVQAYPTCGGPCPFETKTRNFWSSRFSRRPVNSPALMGLLLKGAGSLLPI